MRKKWLFITVAVLITFLLAGCSDILVESWVNADSSVKINMVMEMDLSAIATMIPGGEAMSIDQLDQQLSTQIESLKNQKPASEDITSYDVTDERLSPGRHKITISMVGKDFMKSIGESGSVGSGSKVEKLANGNYQITIPMASAMGSSIPLNDLSGMPPELMTQIQSIKFVWKFHAPTVVKVTGGEKTDNTTATLSVPFSDLTGGGAKIQDFVVEFSMTQSAPDVAGAIGGALSDITGGNIPTWVWIVVAACCCLLLLVVVVVVVVMVTRKKPQQPPMGSYPPR